MGYPSLFARSYFRKQDPELCKERGRDVAACPGSWINEHLLKAVYGPGLIVTNCEASMSLASRADPVFAVLPRRSTRRVYVFENAGPLGSAKSLVGALDLRCCSKAEIEKLEISPTWGMAVYCASGYLRPPMHMTLESGYSLPLLDTYSVHTGLLPFLCTPYVSHHSFFGYVCAQAAVYLALEMLLPLGAFAHSPATLSHIVASIRDLQGIDVGRKPALCSAHADRTVADRDGYLCRGLYTAEIVRLLEDEQLNTRGLQVDASIFRRDVNATTFKHIRSMLASRIPILALVDFDTVAHSLGEYIRVGRTEAHVITIVGFRSGMDGGEPRVVFHDGHLGPYREMSLSAFVEAARAAPNGTNTRDDSVVMCSALPSEVSPDGYLELLFLAEASPGYRTSIRLISVGQLPQYLIRYTPGRALVDGGCLRQMMQKDVSFTHPIWLMEYVDESTGETYVDLVDASTKHARRLGILILGKNTEMEPWRLARVTGASQIVASSAPLEANRAQKEGRTEIISRP